MVPGYKYNYRAENGHHQRPLIMTILTLEGESAGWIGAVNGHTRSDSPPKFTNCEAREKSRLDLTHLRWWGVDVDSAVKSQAGKSIKVFEGFNNPY